MGKVMKASLTIGIVLVLGVYLFAIMHLQQNFEERASKLEERLAAYEMRKDTLSQQVMDLAAVRDNLAAQLEAAQEENARRTLQEQQDALEKEQRARIAEKLAAQADAQANKEAAQQAAQDAARQAQLAQERLAAQQAQAVKDAAAQAAAQEAARLAAQRQAQITQAAKAPKTTRAS